MSQSNMASLKIAVVLALSAISLPNASAQEDQDTSTEIMPDTNIQGIVIDEATWVLERSRRMSVDSSDAGLGTDFVADQQWLVLKGTPKSAITFSCQQIVGDENAQTRLQIAFDLDKSQDEAKEKMLLRHVTGQLTLGDKRKSERFVWNPGTMKMVPHSRNVARRVFNAAIRGDHIKLKTRGETYFDITLPEINQDFRDFVKVCPALQPKPG